MILNLTFNHCPKSWVWLLEASQVRIVYLKVSHSCSCTCLQIGRQIVFVFMFASDTLSSSRVCYFRGIAIHTIILFGLYSALLLSQSAGGSVFCLRVSKQKHWHHWQAALVLVYFLYFVFLTKYNVSTMQALINSRTGD